MDYNFDNIIDSFLVKQKNKDVKVSDTIKQSNVNSYQDKDLTLKESFKLYIKNNRDLIYLKSDGGKVYVFRKDNHFFNTLDYIKNIIENVEFQLNGIDDAKSFVIGKHECQVFIDFFGGVPKEFYGLKIYICNKESYALVI